MKSSLSSAARVAEGWFSSLFTPLKASHYLELVNPLWNYRQLQARVESVWDETPDCRTLTLRPGKGWRRHRAGQHIRVGVEIGGMRHTRTYSISSPPERDDGCITITVKATPGGRVSQHLVRSVAPGSYLPIGLPQGDFVMPEAVPARALYITAGSGITPIMSMLRSMSASGALPDVYHMHFSPHAFNIIYGRELRQLATDHPRYKQKIIYTQDSTSSTTVTNHFTPALATEFCTDWRDRDVWVCGPQGLVDAVKDAWTEVGLASRLHVEQFHAALAPAVSSEVRGGRIRFKQSGRDVEATGQTDLLRLAEDAGLNPAHGCRMGICHGCSAKVISGRVRDVRTGKVTDCESGEVVQICVSAPSGDVEIDL